MISQSIFFFLFFISLFLVVLGYWRKDFTMLGLSGCCFAIIGILVLSSGIDLPNGEEINITRTEINNYEVIDFNFDNEVKNRTVVANVTTIESSNSSPQFQNFKNVYTVAIGMLFILIALYLFFLTWDLSGKRGENDGKR